MPWLTVSKHVQLPHFLKNETGAKKNAKVSVSAVPRLLDNKRKQMEKALSQSKRDQILMNSAKEDLIMKNQMIASLEDSNKSLQGTMQKTTESLSAMAKGSSSEMRMIAMAMSGPTQQHFQPFHPLDHSSHGMMYQSNMYGSPRGYNSGNSPVPEFSGQGSGRSHTPSPTPSESVLIVLIRDMIHTAVDIREKIVTAGSS